MGLARKGRGMVRRASLGPSQALLSPTSLLTPIFPTSVWEWGCHRVYTPGLLTLCQQEHPAAGAKDPKLSYTQVMGKRIDLEVLLSHLGKAKDLTGAYCVILDRL